MDESYAQTVRLLLRAAPDVFANGISRDQKKILDMVRNAIALGARSEYALLKMGI